MVSRTQSYEFGVFRIDPQKNRLFRGEEPVPLPPKAFETLLVLIQRSGEVITKEELMKSLWPDSFVEEANLSQNIFVLRKALGETAQEHRFIVTVPGKGYRFAEDVRLVAGEEKTVVVESHSRSRVFIEDSEVPNYRTAFASLIASTRKAPWNWILLLTAVAILSVTTLILVRMRRSPPLGAADLVLVSDFVNTTGEPIFDDTLKQALEVKLAESPHFNIALDDSVKKTLRLMGRSADARIVPPLGRDVCERMGAKVVVEGAIVAIGKEYVIDLDAEDCLNGLSLAHEESTAQSREQVLPQLGRLIGPLRKRLGESVGLIQKFDTPIEQATTPSLEALKAYTAGDKSRVEGKEAESIPLYKMAVELDPNFSIAYARLSAVYRNLGDENLADQYLKQAFDRREHVTAQEKFYIAGHYYIDATAEIEKGIETYELWTQTYPNDWIPFNNLANEYSRIGETEKAVKAGQQALRLNSRIGFPYQTLATAYGRTSQFAEAKAVCEKAVAAGLDSFATHFTLYYVGFAENDETAMERELAWFKGKPTEAWGLHYEAESAMSRGQLLKARKLWEEARRLAVKNGFNGYASSTAYIQAVFEAEMVQVEQVRSLSDRALKLDPGSLDALTIGALALARAGEAQRAEALLDRAQKRPTKDLLLSKFAIPCARAAIELDRGKAEAAIEALRAAEPYDFADEDPNGGTVYYRGLAYLQLREGTQAGIQFQKLLDNPGVLIPSLYLSLAHLGLARAYVLTGEFDKSRGEYQNFFALWKNADPNLEVLRVARSEYARLTAAE